MGEILLSEGDRLVLGSSIGGFIVFVIAQFVVFRHVNEIHVLRWLRRLMGFGVGVAVGMVGYGFFHKHSLFLMVGWPGTLLLGGLTAFIVAILSGFYVLCVLGPYESSVRLRLIRELYEDFPRAVSIGPLLNRYNAKMILERRVGRLMAAGDIVRTDGVYHKVPRQSFFDVSDRFAKWLCRLTRP